MMNKDGKNPTRARMLRRLFQQRDAHEKRIRTINIAIAALGKDLWENEGHLLRPREERLREFVMSKEFDDVKKSV